MSKPTFKDTKEASFFLIILKGKNRTFKQKKILRKFPFVYTEMFRFNDVDLHINHRKNIQ